MVSREMYEAKVSVASPAQLVVINFEFIIESLNYALEALGEADANKTKYRDNIALASKGVQHLIHGLNYDVAMSQNFNDLYRYSNKLLNNAYFSPAPESVKEVLEIMGILHEGWKQAVAQVDKASLNTPGGRPQVYSGLTYGRDGLEEYAVEDEGRGFKA
jgi:flagellar biosynthetic protein FliS